jgi:hypothetical protein
LQYRTIPNIDYNTDQADWHRDPYIRESVLSSSSLFLRAGASKIVERLSSSEGARFSQDVIDHVCRLNPFLGDRIFHHRLDLQNGEVVDLPILGSQVFGAAVSFASRDYRLRAEAYVAKFNWLRRKLTQQPRVYVLSPSQPETDTTNRLERSVNELLTIAEASNVTVKIADSTEGLASAIAEDETRRPEAPRRIRKRAVGT